MKHLARAVKHLAIAMFAAAVLLAPVAVGGIAESSMVPVRWVPTPLDIRCPVHVPAGTAGTGVCPQPT